MTSYFSSQELSEAQPASDNPTIAEEGSLSDAIVDPSLFEKCIGKLPQNVLKEIFTYIMPNVSDIYFYKSCYDIENTKYNPKYELAYYVDTDYAVINKQQFMLSRVAKKNGKYRYYVTKEFREVDDYDSEGYAQYINNYESNYIGKSLKLALLHIFTANMYEQKYDWKFLH